MKVSIIMCAYNVEAYIEAAIKSILDQTYEHWELIISNDGSTDGTAEIITRFLDDNRIRFYDHEVNKGYLRNKNWAFAQATGDLLTQLDADDLCPKDRLEKQVNVFIQRPDIMICGTNFQKLRGDGSLKEPEIYADDFKIEFEQRDYPFWFPNLMFRKEVLAEFGPFSEYFLKMPGDDHHWTLRVNQKYPIYFLRDVLYYYRMHSASFTKTVDTKYPVKMFVAEILKELYRQRKETGTDWIESGELDKMKAFERQLIHDHNLMAEKYRIWAAMAIDHKDWQRTSFFLKESWKQKKLSKTLLRTVVYYVKARFMSERQIPE